MNYINEEITVGHLRRLLPLVEDGMNLFGTTQDYNARWEGVIGSVGANYSREEWEALPDDAEVRPELARVYREFRDYFNKHRSSESIE